MGCVPKKIIKENKADSISSFKTIQNDIHTEKQEDPLIVSFLLIYSSLKKLKKKFISYLN